MTANIRDRILARHDLDELRAARDITRLAMKLNEECQPMQVPQYVTASAIVGYSFGSAYVMQLLRDVAETDGPLAVRAQALLSPEGAAIMVPGFEPPYVTQEQVAQDMYYPDGTEK